MLPLPRYLILDIDDTLTLHGRLHREPLRAIERAAEAGIEVILNTGRSAGWGAALHAYLAGVSTVIVENGGAWFTRAAAAAAGHEEIPAQLLSPESGAVRPVLVALRQRVAERLGLELTPTADDPFRLTDHTVVRTVPGGAQGAALLTALRQETARQGAGMGRILASSVHIHFFLAGAEPRSKADGVLALLKRRGVADPKGELFRHGVAVGDSGNDESLFVPGRFALSAGVRNIERYLAELGDNVPTHITRAAEGLGVAELVDDLLSGRLAWR